MWSVCSSLFVDPHKCRQKCCLRFSYKLEHRTKWVKVKCRQIEWKHRAFGSFLRARNGTFPIEREKFVSTEIPLFLLDSSVYVIKVLKGAFTVSDFYEMVTLFVRIVNFKTIPLQLLSQRIKSMNFIVMRSIKKTTLVTTLTKSSSVNNVVWLNFRAPAFYTG